MPRRFAAPRLAEGTRAVAERVHGIHADRCPVYRTSQHCVAITTSLELEDVVTRLDNAGAA